MNATHAVVNPTTEEPMATVEWTTRAVADVAIDRASKAFAKWRNTSPATRASHLRRFAAAVDAHVDELADLEVSNAGHTHRNAVAEARLVRDVLEYYSGAPERLIGQQIPVPGGLNVTLHEPLGVVGIIVPWNFPMPIAAFGFAPALAAGNTVVLKPSELTPLTAMRLGELADDAGLPEGVFTVLPGDGEVVGERFVTHPAVRKVCFTGSTAVGRRIMAGCADQIKRFTLELGGKSSNIIFADADLAAAAATTPMSVFDNAGQDCCARSRLLVQRSVFDEFMQRLQDAVAKVRVGDPADPASDMGPLISAAHRDQVLSFVDDCSIIFQGDWPAGPGYWCPPTVALVTDPGERIWREEVFGPVLAVMPFDDEAHAIALANDTEYGLSGSLFTRDIGRALRVARTIESGTLSVNSHSSVRYWTPFGGVKQSGIGRELGPDALLSFTEEKNVFISEQ